MCEWKETEIGRVPLHWDVLPIGNFSNVTKLAGFEYTKFINYVDDGAIIALRALNVRDGVLDLTDVKRIKKEVSDNLIRSKLFIGDILLTYVGANIGQFALIDEDDKYHLAPNICRIRVGEKCDFYYLYSYFRTLYFQDNLLNYQVGSSQPTMPMGNIRKILIPLPPLLEQRAIASVLSSLDDKIYLLHRQNKTLEAMAETLFRQWFVEEADEGWVEKLLSELLTITSSKRIFYSEYVTSGVPFYRSKEIIELRNTGSTSGELYISEDRFNEIHEKFGSPNPGDILMTSVGSLGIPYRVRIDDRFYFKDGNLTWFKDFKGIQSTIIYFWLLSKIGQEELATITIGSTQEALTIEGLKNISFKLPPKEKIVNCELVFNSIIGKIEFNQSQIRTLEKLRDTLLPKLMSGEVRVNLEQQEAVA